MIIFGKAKRELERLKAENERLEAKCHSLKESSDGWHERAMEYQRKVDALESEKESLEKSLSSAYQALHVANKKWQEIFLSKGDLISALNRKDAILRILKKRLSIYAHLDEEDCCLAIKQEDDYVVWQLTNRQFDLLKKWLEEKE